MTEKRMLIIDADLAKKIDENRGDMTVSEFVHFLIDSQLKKNTNNGMNASGGLSADHVTKEEFQQFEQGIRELLRNFLEFFLSYGLELGKHSTEKEIDRLGQKLQSLGFSIKSD